MIKLFKVVVLGLILAAQSAVAEGPEKLVEALKKARPGLNVSGTAPSGIDGLYLVEIDNGAMIVYGTEDGRYLLSGELYELGGDDLINVTEAYRAGHRQELMASLDRGDMVVFSPAGETKAAITVFTDVDCGYCRKLHLEVPDLNKAGVEVRYLAYPRAGVGSKSYEKIVSAWCADKPNDALTDLKMGKEIPTKTCDNPVASQFDLGQKVGVRGTPAILLDNGEMLPGYMPAADLVATLGL